MLRHLQLIKPLWLLEGPEPPFWKLKHEHDILFLMTVGFEVLSSMIADYDNSIDIEGRVKDFENVTIVYGIIKVQILFYICELSNNPSWSSLLRRGSRWVFQYKNA